MRRVFAAVLSLCAVALIAVYELAPRKTAEVREGAGSVHPKDPSPLAEAPPEVLADVDPIGPAKIRPPKDDARAPQVDLRAPGAEIRAARAEIRTAKADSRPQRRTTARASHRKLTDK